MHRFAVAAAVLFLASGCIVRSAIKQAQLPAGGQEVRDLAYYDGPDFDDQKHRLNVFVPPGKGPHPVIVFVHGGGWFFGDRAERTEPYTKLGRRFASRGILTVVISYRLSPKHKHPAHIEDVSRAVAWTFANVEKYGGDKGRIHLMGHSAGAQLVSLAACDPRWLGKHELQPSQLAGVIAISGPFDVKHLGRSLFTNMVLVVPAFGDDVKNWRDVSPATHLGEGDPPPFLVAWADGDPEILRHDGRLFATALQRRGVPVEVYETPYKGHFSVITDLGEEEDLLGDVVTNYVFSSKTKTKTKTKTKKKKKNQTW